MRKPARFAAVLAGAAALLLIVAGAAAAVPVAEATDTTPPVISGLKVTNARFRVGSRASAQLAAGRKAPVGTVFRFNLTERSTLVLVIGGMLAGREVGRECVVGAAQGQRCKTFVLPGAIIRSRVGPGLVSIPFTGRVGTRLLAPGSYAAAVAAVDAAGNRSRPKTVTFTVLPT